MANKDKWFNNPFKGLRKELEAKVVPKAPEPIRPIEPIEPVEPAIESSSDEEVFLKAMAGVREIKDNNSASPVNSARKFVKPAEDEDAILELRSLIEQKTDIRISDTDEYDEWVPPGGQPDLLGRLHRGECSVQDHIDLHGLNEEEAEMEFEGFLVHSRKAGLSCIKVIHGRGLGSPGEPVLKPMVSRMLKGSMSKHVRAYATAPPHDGGLGATYILLRGQ